MSLPSDAILNAGLSEKYGDAIIKWEVLHFSEGKKALLRFVSKNSTWRQGVWLRCDSNLVVEGRSYGSVELWEDNVPEIVEIGLPAQGGELHFYNIWDRGRGRESQSFTSGMLLEIEGGIRRYKCNDIGTEPNFSKLVFELDITPV